MKNLIIALLFCSGFYYCKSQEAIKYSVNNLDTRFVKTGEVVSLSIANTQKKLTYSFVNIKISFKKREMKLLKTIKDTTLIFPLSFSKNPVVEIKPWEYTMFGKADAITFLVGDVMKKEKKTTSAILVSGKEKEFEIRKF